MKQFDLPNYLNSLKEIKFPTQNEFTNAKYWQRNIIKDLKTPFDVPNIILGKKYYIDWTNLESKYKGGRADIHYKMMRNCGIGEIIFEKIALYKSTFGGTEISLWGICATPNGVDNFKIMLKDKMETYNQTTIHFKSIDLEYNLFSDVYTDKTLRNKIIEKGIVFNGTKIAYNELASAQLSMLGYNVCNVNGLNTITTCEWNGVEVVAIEPKVVTYNTGFAFTTDKIVLSNGYSEDDTMESREKRTFPYQSYQECVNNNKIKFTTFDDEDDETQENNREISFTFILNGKMKMVNNLYELNDLLDELKKLI